MIELGLNQTDTLDGLLIRAAVDKALGYGADSFVSKPEASDPWGKECFVTLSNVLIDHDECWYLLPTAMARDPDADMPELLLAARTRHDISPAQDKVAEDVRLTEEFIKGQFSLLETFVLRDWQRIRRYDLYHRLPEMRKAHYDVMADLGLESTTIFCQANKEKVSQLERLARLPQGELTYIFDEVLRTVRDEGIAEPLGACYFSHPIKSSFGLPPNCKTEQRNIQWDWGRKIAYLVNRGRIRSHPEAIMDVVHEIRSEVKRQSASSHVLKYYKPNQQRDALEAVACAAKLDAVVRQDVLLALAAFFGVTVASSAVAAAAGAEPYAAGAFALAGLAGAALTLRVRLGNLTNREVAIPGSVARYLKVCRGVLEWPEDSVS